MNDRNMHDANPGVLIGGVLVVVGAWLIVRRWLFVTPIWALWLRIRPFSWPVALILIGTVVILLASREGRPRMPARGTRLYRSRHDKWLSGVIGGIAEYFGIDSLALRIAFVAVAMVFGWWQTLIAYFVAAWVMPEEPEAAPTPRVSSPG